MSDSSDDAPRCGHCRDPRPCACDMRSGYSHTVRHIYYCGAAAPRGRNGPQISITGEASEGEEPAEWHWSLSWSGTPHYDPGGTVATLDEAKAAAEAAIPRLLAERDEDLRRYREDLAAGRL
jgi:hypothetical protein